MRATFTIGLFSAMAALTASACAGIIVGSDQDLPPVGPIFISHDNASNTNTFESDLTFDPAAGVIEKQFQTPWYSFSPVQNVVITLPTILGPGSTINIVETYQIDTGQPVSDWHEAILTPGWEWTFDPNTPIISSPPASSWSYTVDSTSPDTFLVHFDPITPGTPDEPHTLTIQKQLLWVGTSDEPAWGSSTSQTYVSVLEWSAPEPSSIALLAFGGLAVLRRR